MAFIYLIRHGETVWNEKDILQGQSDPPLSDRGRLQAQKLAGALAGRHIERFYVSPLRRTVETFNLIQPGGAPHLLVAGFMERSMGQLEGYTWEENDRRFPGAREENRKNTDFTPPGGESMKAFYARVVGAFERLLPLGEDVAIVCHGGTIRMLLNAFLEGTLRRLHFAIDNTSVSLIELGEEVRVHAINDTSHL